MSHVSLHVPDLSSYNFPFYPAKNTSQGDFVGVAIWSAVEPIAGIFGAVSLTEESFARQWRRPKISRVSCSSTADSEPLTVPPIPPALDRPPSR